MLIRKLAVALLAVSVVGIVSSSDAFGQSNRYEPSRHRPKKSLFEEIGSFGRSVFGDILPTKEKDNERTGNQGSHSVARRTPSQPQRSGSMNRSRMTKSSGTRSGSDRPTTVFEDMPLQNRLKSFQQSVFGTDTRSTDRRKAALVRKRPGAVTPAEKPEIRRRPAPVSPTIVSATPPVSETPEAVTPHRVSTRQPAEGLEKPSPTIVSRPTPAEDSPTPLQRAQASNPARAINDTEKVQPPVRLNNRVLMEGKGPALSVQTAGPRKISVGKESKYELTLTNTGDVAAGAVVVLVNIPDWADLVGADASTGATMADFASPDGEPVPFEWRVGRVETGARQQLTLRIIPRESRPFDLAVRWHYKPVASPVMIEVIEPKLSVDLEGPHDVLYGKSEIYELRIANTGTGDAENVIINLTPMGSDGSRAISHNLGNLASGEKKSIEVELTAREVGKLVIKVDVRGDGGLHANLAEQVLVRRANLEVDVTGPPVQFVGTIANYHVRVRNGGTAAARNVKMSVNLPNGAKYLSGIEGAQQDSGKVEWTVDSLEASAEKTYSIKCRLEMQGVSRVDVVSMAEGDLSATADTTTRAEAMADLVLDVKDPTSPVQVGKEATYELCVRNRGSKNAQDVEVIAYFSEGIEPVSAEGNEHKIEPGQVIFSTISNLGAGSETVLRIRARADLPGNHVFRVEVRCKPLGTRLVSEETTHFYQVDAASQQASFTPADATPISAPKPLRSVGKQRPLETPNAPKAAVPAALPQGLKPAIRLR